MTPSEDERVRSRVHRAIEAWDPVEGSRNWSDDRFDELASAVFTRQFRRNAAYRRFCRRRGIEAAEVETYRDIPAVATEVFKHVDLGTTDDPVRTFRTSGTTRERRGRHHFATLRLYRRSLHRGFVRFVNPGREQFRILVCAPSPADVPDSSLSFMFGAIVDRWSDGEGGFFATDDDSGLSFDFDAMAEAIDDAERAGAPTMVLGTAYGLAAFFDRTTRNWHLPDGSRVFETGGFKDTDSDWTARRLYEAFEERFGVPRERCVGEYSMTELSTQAYTTELSASPEDGEVESGFVTPPWARIEIVDPASPRRVCDRGERGLVRWYDLANVDSVCAIQTSDVGRRTGAGVEHLGRAEGSELRGCSLTAEEIVEDSP